MLEEDIVCVIRAKKKRFKKYSEEYIVENISGRAFIINKDNEKISTDVTEINTAEGKLYLSGIIDMHSKSLITYDVGNSNNNELVFNNFKNFIDNNDIELSNIILESDRGFQYTLYGFKQIIKEMKHSNSPIESFWGTFKAAIIIH